MSTKIPSMPRSACLVGFALLFVSSALQAQSAKVVELQIKADQISAHVSPDLYGLMTEEINHAYDGGLYAELIQNRSFEEDAQNSVHWQLVQLNGGAGSMSLDPNQPLNSAIATSLKLTIAAASSKQSVGVANEGFWGIPSFANTAYRASFFAKASSDFKGPITVAIVSNDSGTVLATADVPAITGSWQKYEATLKTGSLTPSTANRFLITAHHAGTVWLSTVSLFPPTYNNRSNGNRPDIMRLFADMQPAFLRFPGGNYLEGNTIATRFNWKKTIGDISQRPGHMNDAWKYWSSDGLGVLEFLEWCEDLHMKPLLAVYAGYSLKGERVEAGEALAPYVNDALDEIEYVTGDVSTKWGAERAKDGHPAPFSLDYVEVGNEDNFDREAGGYERRFDQFFDAIKAKYPKIEVIATAPVTARPADLIDEHYYRNSADEMAFHANDYDSRRRSNQKVFVGEWATRVGSPTPNMDAGLADAAWLIGIERNSDLVTMASYAPLFVNVNEGAMQWHTNLIGYDAATSYGSPTYYVQKMFSLHHGDVVVPVAAHNIPTSEWQPPASGQRQPMIQAVPLMFFDATRDSKTGRIYIKAVNRSGSPEDVHVTISGVASVASDGEATVLEADSLSDTNSLKNPSAVAPNTVSVDGLSADFTKTAPPYSVSILEVDAH
jgi:alpha-N-arabinofuranosidase